jgi:heme exporter protein D
MDLGPHAAFIITAYAIAAAIVAALLASTMLDYRRQTRALADLEARGVVRRSERGAPFSAKVDSGFPSENATNPPS